MKNQKDIMTHRPFQFSLADIAPHFPLACRPECPRQSCPAETKIAAGCPVFPQFGKRAYQHQHSILTALRSRATA